MLKTLRTKDKNKRNFYENYESSYLILKSVINNQFFSKKIRQRAYVRLLNLKRDHSLTRVRNRCVLTNRARSNYKLFKMSRLMFRKYA
jgi:succinate dehydrogenase (ubiquinone) iron-sulfur subunit